MSNEIVYFFKARRISAEGSEVLRTGGKPTSEGDLFDVHDFDVKIDLEVPTGMS